MASRISPNKTLPIRVGLFIRFNGNYAYWDTNSIFESTWYLILNALVRR